MVCQLASRVKKALSPVKGLAKAIGRKRHVSESPEPVGPIQRPSPSAYGERVLRDIVPKAHAAAPVISFQFTCRVEDLAAVEQESHAMDLCDENEGPDSITGNDDDADDGIDPASIEGCTDDDVEESTQPKVPFPPGDEFREGKQREAPPLLQAQKALDDIIQILAGKPIKSGGYKHPDYDPFARPRMEGMRALLTYYTNPRSKATYGKWGASALTAAIGLGCGRYCARQLASLCRQFILDRSVLPLNPYGAWNESRVVDEDFICDFNLFLQELGKDISAAKVMDWLRTPEIKKKHGITKDLSERTARRYLNILGYRWKSVKKGQFVDGHEREDVVVYRQDKFLPVWKELQKRTVKWITTRGEDPRQEYGPFEVPGRRVIIWFHDETIFYANDRRKIYWYHKDASATPQAKGEGATLMYSNFISADFGWLVSTDGQRNAAKFMKPGKSKDGYITNEDVQDQATEAMDILLECYPEYEHVLVYDNATTHCKRAEDAISARRMTKGPSDKFGVSVTNRDSAGKPIYVLGADGTPEIEKIKIKMGNGSFEDGTPQSFYFEDGPNEGKFKGMVQILQERGHADAASKLAECKGFKCAPPALNCCCRRMLFNEPDFVNVPSALEELCAARGVQVLFLPKFHCELNFIEQVWGYAKRVYRLNPASSREDALERNARTALESVPLESMRR